MHRQIQQKGVVSSPQLVCTDQLSLQRTGMARHAPSLLKEGYFSFAHSLFVNVHQILGQKGS